MSWLRIDDGFSRHPKVLSLTASERWVWLDVLCWAAKYAEDHGHLPDSSDLAIPGLRKLRPKLRCLGLLDEGEIIHDWYLYSSASLTEKVVWYLERHPEASANEVARQVGGTRNLVLAEVRRYREGDTANGSIAGTAEPGEVVRNPVHARTRPVPSPSPREETLGVDDRTNDAGDTNAHPEDFVIPAAVLRKMPEVPK